jgi:glycosyltransferase involved in cell wall biosynthesis
MGMRIVLVTDTFAPAADAVAETSRHIADALIAAGHEVLVFTTSPGSDTYRGATVHRTRALFSVASLRRTTARFAPDIVQFIAPRALGAAAMRALEHTGVPLVALDPTPLHPRVCHVLASSEAGARVLATAGVPARVWRPGVRTDEHHPGLRCAEAHARWSRARGTDEQLFVAGYVGPVGPATTRVTRRLAQVAALDGVRLVVLGSGPGTSHLKAAGAKIIGDATGLEQARALATFDVLVQPRKHETTLTTIRKALASGVPVVAFETAAATEVVVSGRNGVLVGADAGFGGLADAVADLAADSDRLNRLAAHARASVMDRTWDDAVADLIAYYEPKRRAV